MLILSFLHCCPPKTYDLLWIANIFSWASFIAPGTILQDLWIYSCNWGFVPKYWCLMVSAKWFCCLSSAYYLAVCSQLIQHLHLYHRYFFAEVFDFFRNFFLIVFHVNILFMILPLAIRLNHRPCFLAFLYMAVSSMLKSYPSVSLPLLSNIQNMNILHFSGGKFVYLSPVCYSSSFYETNVLLQLFCNI